MQRDDRIEIDTILNPISYQTHLLKRGVQGSRFNLRARWGNAQPIRMHDPVTKSLLLLRNCFCNHSPWHSKVQLPAQLSVDPQ